MELPGNAYSELRREKSTSRCCGRQTVKEVTSWSVGMGLLMAVIFSAAAAYSDSKSGRCSGSHPHLHHRRRGLRSLPPQNALGQNVIIQSICLLGRHCGGAVFTIPGLYILQANTRDSDQLLADLLLLSWADSLEFSS